VRACKIASESSAYAGIAQWRNPLMVGIRNLIVRNIPERLMERRLAMILNNLFEPVTSGD
jgi:hypothetical protein